MSLFDSCTHVPDQSTSQENQSQRYIEPQQSLVLSEPMILNCQIQKQPQKSLFNFMRRGQQYNQTQNQRPNHTAPLNERIIQLKKQFILLITGSHIKIYQYADASIKARKKEPQMTYIKRSQDKNMLDEEIIQKKKQFIDRSLLNHIDEIQLDIKQIKNVKVFKWTWVRQKALGSNLKDKPRQIYIIVEDNESRKLELICYNVQSKKLQKSGKVSPPTFILCWNFIFYNQIIVWANNMNLYHYVLTQKQGFKCIRTVPSYIDPNKQLYQQKQVERKKQKQKSTSLQGRSQIRSRSASRFQKRKNNQGKDKNKKGVLDYLFPEKLPPQPESKTQSITLKYQMNFCTILGYRDPDQQQVMPLFFTLYNQEYNILKIKCIQIMYPLLQIDKNPVSYSKFVDPFLNLKQNSLSIHYPTIYAIKKVYEIISHNTACPQLVDEVQIEQLGNSYYLKLKSQFIFLQKKYDHYYAIDSVGKINPKTNLLVAQNSNLLASHSQDSTLIQINEINGISISENHNSNQIQPKLSLKMIDFIDLRYEIQLQKAVKKQTKKIDYYEIRNKFGWFLPTASCKQQQLQKFQFLKDKDHKKLAQKQQQQSKSNNHVQIKLHKFWINHVLNQYDFYFMVEIYNQQMLKNKQQSLLCVYRGRKFSKQTKILELSQEAKDQSEVVKIKDIGKILGINQTQFYYNLWKQSDKKFEDIKKYLLPCKDFNKIVDQLKVYLRRRPMYITHLISILKYLLVMIKEKVKHSLTEDDLRSYFNSEFVLRKFMIYDSNYEIDDKQFSKAIQGNLLQIIQKLIQETLHPKMKKVSVWEQQLKQPPKLQLVVIFHMFKFPLLDDYPQFLNQIYNRHSDEIINLLNAFPQILPKYPYFTQDNYILLKQSQKIFRPNTNQKKVAEDLVDLKNMSTVNFEEQDAQNSQVGVFSKILPKNFAEQSAFIHNFVMFLDKQYSGSSVLKMIEDLFNIKKQKQNKNKHPMKKFYNNMLINRSVGDFVQNLKLISGQTLHIYTLQYLIKSAHKRKQKANITGLIDLFRKNYGMCQQLLKVLQVRAGLYEIIITHQLLNINSVKLDEVVKTPIEKWIALFFLGNKQQKQLLVTQFMDLFQIHEQYTDAISSYVKSEHCSKIQLSIMSQQISKMSEQEQLQSQSLIQVIINGFCQKIHLRDTADCNNFLHHINQLHFTPELLFKVDRIEKFKLCLRIFEVFYLQDKTLYELLNNTYGIIGEMMEAFFNGQLRREQVPVKRSYIQIEDCYGMWDLLCYLKDSVFFDITTQELLMAYCKKLIQWQRFDEVRDLLFESDRIICPQDQQQIKPTIVCKKLINQSIKNLYETQNLLFDQGVKKYIKSIISIDKYPAFNQRIIKEKAKLDLVEMLESWGYQVALMDLQTMCNQWQSCRQQANSQAQLGGMYYRPVMIEIIEKYGQHLDLQKLQDIYGYFMTATEGIQEPTIKTDQFYNYCSKLCQVLMGLDRLREASEIICILNQKFQMNYLLMVECMIKSLIAGFQKKFNKNKRDPQNDKILEFDQSQILHSQEQEDQDILDDDQFKYKKKYAPENIEIGNIFANLGKKTVVESTPPVAHSQKAISQIITNTQAKIAAVKVQKWKCLPTQKLLINSHSIGIDFIIQKNNNDKKQHESPTSLYENIQQKQKIMYANRIKKYIQFFVMHWTNKKQQKLNQIFEDFFMNDVVIDQKIEFPINHDICFKNHRHKINTEVIWNLAVFGISEKVTSKRTSLKRSQSINLRLREQVSIQELSYCYFLLLMGLIQPKLGFQMLEYISYPHHACVKMFSMFEQWCDYKKQLYCIDYSIIFKIYLNSLTKLLVYKYEGDGFLELGYSDNPYIINKQNNISQQNTTPEPFSFNNLFKQVISENLQLFRTNLKQGFYKEDPLHGVVLKMAQITNKAKKRSGHRLIMYNSSVKTNQFRLGDKLKKLNKKQITKDQNVEKERSSPLFKILAAESIQKQQNQLINEQEIRGMRFEDFRKMKKKILRQQKSKISQYSEDSMNQITERSVVHQIIRHLKSPNDHNTTLNIPISHNQAIKDQVAESIKQVKDKNKRDASYVDISLMNDDISRQNLTLPPYTSRTQPQMRQPVKKIKTIEQFIQVINSDDYSIVDFWSPDAILIETYRCYEDERVNFVNVINMFHQLMVGNHNKINIIYSSLPDIYDDPLKTKNIIWKKLFPLKYLNRDFPPQYSKHYDQLCGFAKEFINLASIEQIVQVGWIINGICQIQYRKVHNRDWRFILAEVAIERVGRKGQYDDYSVKRIYEVMSLFHKFKGKGQAYIKQNFSVIYSHFLKGQSEHLIKAFQECIKTMLDINIEELKQQMMMRHHNYKKNYQKILQAKLHHENDILDNQEQDEGFKQTDSFMDS